MVEFKIFTRCTEETFDTLDEVEKELGELFYGMEDRDEFIILKDGKQVAMGNFANKEFFTETLRETKATRKEEEE